MLSPGTRLGPYEITAQIGTGGMGEVYRATDTILKRAVAIKVLPAAVATDSDRLARFQREAEVLAALNHPNIAQIYGLEKSGGVLALVMELVEGETLADRIAGRSGGPEGPPLQSVRRGGSSDPPTGLPLDEALPIARQIAEALEAAHEQGIIHRDLKPANIKVRPDGTVKVLDFGLAKAMEPPVVGRGFSPAGGVAASQAPTITSPALLTGAGMILGTAAYMSPEQARGKAVDKRADIWAFGCVLYEMLTGRRAFVGEDMADTIGAIIHAVPDQALLPATTPLPVRRLLRRCLEKDPKSRIADASTARIEITEAVTGQGDQVVPAAVISEHPTRRGLVWAAAILAAMAAAAAIAWFVRPAAADSPEIRLQVLTPPAGQRLATSFALSPDGRSLAYSATVDGKTQLWLRQLERETARPLPGTDGAAAPFWSPDSRSIGFFADQKLKRIETSGGAARVLADAPLQYGGAWGNDGVILFVPSNTSPVSRLPASGGAVVEAVPLRPGQASHRFPSFLPDGRHFLFFVTGVPSAEGIYVGTLDSNDARRLFESDSAGVLVPPDVVLFRREDTLMGQRLTQSFEPAGDAFMVAETVASDSFFAASVAASTSVAGPWAYRSAVVQRRQMAWFNRSGAKVGDVTESDDAVSGSPRISPDGRAVALGRRDAGELHVWLIETARGLRQRLTSNSVFESGASWSPDSRRIAFHASSQGSGVNDIFAKSVDDTTAETALLQSDENKNVHDWSSDGRFILYQSQNATTGRDLWALPLDSEGTPGQPIEIARTQHSEVQGRFSPDGRWVAYQSNETGRAEIYVQPFPGRGRNTQVSTAGGGFPTWNGDREIVYRAPDGRVVAVPVTPDANGTIEVGAPAALFNLPANATWDLARDGRFLVNLPLDDPSTPPITVVLNWKPTP